MKNVSKTSIFQKLAASLINFLLAGVLSLPIFFLFDSVTLWKISLIIIFFLDSFLFMLLNKNRDLGMIIVKTYWQKQYSIKQQILYNCLYTVSFSTLFVWVIFPFDIFLINLLLVQLPFVMITGTTAHGYLSGKMTTVTI